jgi:hypothetical protein
MVFDVFVHHGVLGVLVLEEATGVTRVRKLEVVVVLLT